MMRECPQCRLMTFQSDTHCKCGHDFRAAPAAAASPQGPARPTERTIVINVNRGKVVLLTGLAVMVTLASVLIWYGVYYDNDLTDDVYRQGLTRLIYAPLLLLGLALLYWLLGVTITISPEEVALKRRTGREVCRWDDVEQIVRQTSRVLSDVNCDCIFIKRDGSRFRLAADSGADNPKVINTLRRYAEARGLPWKEA